MKPVFKCDYCNFMSTEDEVKKHEPSCYSNYDRKSCHTCEHKKHKSLKSIECACGKEVPDGKIYEFCEVYKRKEKATNLVDEFFGALF